jgi:dihydroorotate dehydrogenase (fumarate)
MLNTTIGDVSLSSCLLNASGCGCSTIEELKELDSISNLGAIVSKSTTLLSRSGNPLPRIGLQNGNSINSVNLANQGIVYYINARQQLVKPYMISLHPFTPVMLKTMLQLIVNEHIGLVEINLSCPNLGMRDNDANKHNSFITHLQSFVPVLSQFSDDISIGLKLPAFIEDYDSIVSLILKSRVKFVTCCNTLPNGLIVDCETKETLICQSFGGIGGKALKPIALAVVWKLYQRLQHRVDIIGCGGISTAEDVLDYILCGASAVQVGTHLLDKGVKAIEVLAKDLRELMTEYNIQSVRAIKGQLQVCLPSNSKSNIKSKL